MKASVLFLWLAACSQDGAASPAVAWPAGTVLAVDGVPVLAAEVEPIAAAIAELYPENTRPHCLRLALTNVNLPRAALQSRFAKERADGAMSDVNQRTGRLDDTQAAGANPGQRLLRGAVRRDHHRLSGDVGGAVSGGDPLLAKIRQHGGVVDQVAEDGQGRRLDVG